MSPEAQRIAIAEACGWKFPYPSGLLPPTPEQILNDYKFKKPIPDYLNDLNAMHEAEKILTNKELIDTDNFIRTQQGEYCSTLEHVVTTGTNWSLFSCYAATASQRAEAFLKTLGLWKP